MIFFGIALPTVAITIVSWCSNCSQRESKQQGENQSDSNTVIYTLVVIKKKI